MIEANKECQMAVSVGPETVILLHRPKMIRCLFKQLYA